MSWTGKWSNALQKKLRKELNYFRFDAIASGAQMLLEEIILPWVESYMKSQGIFNIGFSGGVFMNVKLNKIIAESKLVKNFTFVPSSGDESLVFGSWIYSLINNKNKSLKDIILLKNKLNKKGLLIGTCYKNNFVKKELKAVFDEDNFKIIDSYEKILEIATNSPINGKVGARFCGEMEFGARSLGNKSILCSASSMKQIYKINKAIKSRDFWMPFAPIVLDIDALKLFNITKENIQEYQYMQLAAGTKKLAKDTIPAALHP